MNYDDRLKFNREQQGEVEEPWRVQWNILKETDEYKYDPTYDYLHEGGVLKRTINVYKRDDYADPELVARSVFLTTSGVVDKHKLAYVYWLDYAAADFKKDWKPNKVSEGLAYLWLTWNFKSDASLADVKFQIDRIVNHSIFSKCKITYTFEFYTDKGSHPHVHMLVELKRTGNINPSDIKDKIFSKELKKIITVEGFNYLYSWATGKYIEKRCKSKEIYFAYLSGNKKENKNENCDKDKEWRQLNNLENLYIKDN